MPVAAALDVRRARPRIASCCSAVSLALIDRLMPRDLRSMLMIIALTLSPSFRHVASIFHAVARDFRSAQVAFDFAVSVITAPFGSTDFTVPSTMAPLSFIATKLLNGSPSSCLMPSEMRSFSTSMPRTTASTSSPFLYLRTASSPVSRPRQVRQVHQTVDAARQTDEHAEVGDRLDRRLDLVALLVGAAEVVPRVRLALLHAQADTAAVFVDFENHDFDFVAQLHNLRSVQRSCWSSPFPTRAPGLRCPDSTSTNAP